MGKEKDKNQEVGGFLGAVERIGNALPHPAVIFVILSVIVIIVSALTAGVSETYYDAREGADVTVEIVSLFNEDGFRHMFNTATDNYTGFAPLGTVLVAMLGVGVAEWSGLIDSALKKLIQGVPDTLMTAVVVFAGIMSNIASDAGYVVVIPLGAMVFAGAGRHPIAGLAAAFAGVSGGFSANLIIGTLDPLLAGITNAALEGAGIDYIVQPTANIFFMMVSTVMLTIIGTIITERVVEKNLGEYTGSYVPDDDPITEKENIGLRNAGISLIILALVMGFLMFGEGAILKEPNAEGEMVLDNFMNNGMITLILVAFLVPGVVYGKSVNKINDSHDFVEAMTSGMRGLAGYMVLAFFAAQFVNYFGYTNMGTVISVKGANFLESIGFTGLPLVIAFILVSAFLNLFMGSASAKWAIMAPIFVPMLYELNISPELTQAAYRIGDSTTNIITPLMSYFAMIVTYAQRYDEESGLGTLISTMLPYSGAFLLSWTILISIWYFLDLPLGPGAPIHVSMLLLG